MKRQISYILALYLSCLPCFAQDGFQGLLTDLDDLERRMQLSSNPSVPMVQRLSNLEQRLFGAPRSGSMVSRLQAIKAAASEMPRPAGLPEPTANGGSSGNAELGTFPSNAPGSAGNGATGSSLSGADASRNGAAESGNGTAGSGNGAVGSSNGAAGSGNGAVGSGNGAAGSGNGAVGSGNGAAGSGNGAAGSRNSTAGSGNGEFPPAAPSFRTVRSAGAAANPHVTWPTGWAPPAGGVRPYDSIGGNSSDALRPVGPSGTVAAGPGWVPGAAPPASPYAQPVGHPPGWSASPNMALPVTPNAPASYPPQSNQAAGSIPPGNLPAPVQGYQPGYQSRHKPKKKGSAIPSALPPVPSSGASNMPQRADLPAPQSQPQSPTQQQSLPPSQQQSLPPTQQQSLPPTQQQLLPPTQQQLLPPPQQQSLLPPQQQVPQQTLPHYPARMDWPQLASSEIQIKNFEPDALRLINAFPTAFNLVRMEPEDTALKARPNYFTEVEKASKGKHCRFKNMPIPVYIQPFPDRAFVNCVLRAFESWENQTDGVVKFSQIENPNQARIQVVWKHLGGNKDAQGCLLGAHTIFKYVNHGNGSLALMSVGAIPVPIYIPRMGPKFTVPPQVVEVNLDLIMSKDPATKYPCLQNIVTHELGHALGLLGHSLNQADVMYPVTDEHSRLSQRDVNTVIKLYNTKCDVPL